MAPEQEIAHLADILAQAKARAAHTEVAEAEQVLAEALATHFVSLWNHVVEETAPW